VTEVDPGTTLTMVALVPVGPKARVSPAAEAEVANAPKPVAQRAVTPSTAIGARAFLVLRFIYVIPSSCSGHTSAALPRDP
jgi:hypothetical protein